MPGIDIRRVIGLKILAKAIHITNLAECTRRFGANVKIKEPTGIVVKVITIRTITN